MRPDGTPKQPTGPSLHVAEPTDGTWRFVFAGAKAFGFPLLYLMELPR